MGNVVVTGGYGFVGCHLVSALLDLGEEITVLDLAKNTRDTSLDFDSRKNFRFVPCDVTDFAELAEVLDDEVDVVYHLSAVVGISKYISDPLHVFDVNVGGTRNILELSRRHGFKVLLASTSEVFGKNPSPPFREDDDRVLGSTRTARWSYSTSKAMAEHVAFAMHDAFQIPVTVVRYFNLYGPRQSPIFVVSQSVHRVLNGMPPLLYDSGDQTRCFTYIDDAVKATILAANSAVAIGEAFNIGSMHESTIREVVEKTIHHAGLDGKLEPELVDTRKMYGAAYEDIPHRVPDTTKASKVLGWHLETDLDDGIKRTIEWARANPWYLK